MNFSYSKKAGVGLLAVSGIALMALQPIGVATNVGTILAGAAHAESHTDHGGGQGGGDDHSHDDGGSDDHSHDDGPEDDHDHADGGSGKGPKAGAGQDGGSQAGSGHAGGQGGNDDGQGSKGGSGNRPVWAGEGIPEVELGRLNVVRSPSHVLDRAYEEGLASFTASMAEFYNLPLDQAIAKLRTEFETAEFIDSPLQNLALLRDALDGSSVLNDLEEVENTNETLMAMFLGTASDKTIPITPEAAYSVALILGYELSQASSTALAADAEAVRQAVLEGHG